MLDGAVCCFNCTAAVALNQLYVNLKKREATNATGMEFQITVLIGKDECKETFF